MAAIRRRATSWLTSARRSDTLAVLRNPLQERPRRIPFVAFIERVERGQVYFAHRTRPERWAKSLFVLNPIYTSGELKKERDLAHVPVPAARWLGHRLAAVPPPTLREAFDDAGYTQENAIGVVSVLIDRNRLSKL
jgi:hypothetical protein